MDEHTHAAENTPPEAPPAPAEPQDGVFQARDLRRDVTGLIARVDQAEEAIATISVEQMVLVFALGALAGVVFLHRRELRELARAVAE